MTRIAILGPGAVGGLLAAVLDDAGRDVVLLGREQRLACDGVRVTSPRFGDLHAHPPRETHLEADAGDVLVVAVKAPALEEALARVTGTPQAVVPLLNGVEHVAALRERFADVVVPATIRVQAHREAPDHVVHRAPFVTVTLADPGCAPLAEALEVADVDVAQGGTEADVLWGKLSRLAALALATAAADAPLGEVRDDARAVAAEVAAVARAEGAAIDPDAVVGELDGLPDAASSSLRADVAAGGTTELDAIGGAVLRAAGRHGLAAPRTAELTAAVGHRLGAPR